MTKEEVNYVISYYNKLILPEELKELNEYQPYRSFRWFMEKSNENIDNPPESLVSNLDVDLSKLHVYTEENYLKKREEIARNLLKRNPNAEIKRCPVCNVMLRTPQAKQCRNGHKW